MGNDVRKTIFICLFILLVGVALGAIGCWIIFAGPARADIIRLNSELQDARRDIDRARDDLARVGGLLRESQDIGNRIAIEAGRISDASKRGIYLVGKLREILGIVKQGLDIAIPQPAP